MADVVDGNVTVDAEHATVGLRAVTLWPKMRSPACATNAPPPDGVRSGTLGVDGSVPRGRRRAR